MTNKIHEEMLNILGYKGNANQNNIEIHFTPVNMTSSITAQQQMPVRMQGKKEPLPTVGGNENLCNQYGK
jgi:hypothetical protein